MENFLFEGMAQTPAAYFFQSSCYMALDVMLGTTEKGVQKNEVGKAVQRGSPGNQTEPERS